MQATTNAKTFRSHFLFQTHCDGSRRRWFLLWNWGFLIAAAIGTGLLSLLLAVGRYPWDIFLGYFRHPLIAFLNILPVVLLILLLSGVLKERQIRQSAAFLTENMGILFIPAAVGTLEYLDVLKAQAIPFLLITVVSTPIVYFITAWSVQLLMKLFNRKKVQHHV